MQVYRRNIPVNTPQGRKAVKIILTLVMLTLSVIFIFTGVIIKIASNKVYSNCTEEISAEVIDLREHTSTSHHKGRSRTSITYRPVFEYTYNGKNYVRESNISSDPPEYEIGETVKLKIDPDDPNKFYDPSSKVISVIGFVFAGVGVLMLIIYIVVMIALSKKKVTDDQAEIETVTGTDYNYYDEEYYKKNDYD